MKIELRESKIYVNNEICCDLSLNKKQIIVNGKYPYDFIIKLGFNGYRIIQNGTEVGKGKGFEIVYNYRKVRPSTSNELASINLINGNKVDFIDNSGISIGNIKFDNGILVADFDSSYYIFAILYLSYIFGTMNKTILSAYRSGKLPENPILSLRIGKSYGKLSTIMFVVLLILIIFISSFSIIISYILTIMLLMVPIITRALTTDEYINFYNDYFEVISRKNLNNQNATLQYSDIMEIKNYKKGFIIYLKKPIYNKSTFTFSVDPKINDNTTLSNFIRQKMYK